MSAKQTISFICGDKRQAYMAERLSQEGYEIMVYGLAVNPEIAQIATTSSLTEAFQFGKIIIGPVPFSKNHKTITSIIPNITINITTFLDSLQTGHILAGGCFNPYVKKYCEKKRISFLDFMLLDEVSTKNAVATAEGAIAEAITKSPINLHKSQCLILGYGKCGKVLAAKLKGLDASVTIAARNLHALETAASLGFHTLELQFLKKNIAGFSYIFNTIPAMILNKAELENVNKNAIIIDISSSPGGVDQESAKKFGISTSLCLGLPGKYAPKTSADILTDALISNLL